MSRISASVWAAVFVGGLLGAGLRLAVHEFIGGGGVVNPWPTLIVNLIACFLLAFVSARWQARAMSNWLRNGISAGLIGTFSTFSALMIELFVSLYNGNLAWALGLLAVSLLGGAVLSAWGYELGRASSSRLRQVEQ